MLELNGDKWIALHLLTNELDPAAPTKDSDNISYYPVSIKAQRQRWSQTGSISLSCSE